jgi:ABC-type phosphate transport system substrate-binding protein
MTMRVRRLSMGAILLLLAAAVSAAEPQRGSVAFLVPASNPLRNLSTGDLRRVFLGEISRWNDGHRIILFIPAPDTPARQTFLDRVVRMSDIDYSQWWLGAVFRGRAANAPRVMKSADAMIRAVATTPDAIGFVVFPPAGIDPAVVLLTIDGRSPSDSTYPVRER